MALRTVKHMRRQEQDGMLSAHNMPSSTYCASSTGGTCTSRHCTPTAAGHPPSIRAMKERTSKCNINQAQKQTQTNLYLDP